MDQEIRVAAATERRRNRRYDPERRHRIAAAAVSVLRDSGVLALNHRAVAKEADVPLGSTTYHYRSLDDLLAAALEQISDEEVQILADWQSDRDLTADLSSGLIDLLNIYCNRRRAMSIMEYEIHILAYRRPFLREFSHRWDRALHNILSLHMDDDEAEAVIAMMDGVMLNNLTEDSPLTDEWARYCLDKVLPRPADR